MTTSTTQEIVSDAKDLPVNIDEVEWYLKSEVHEFLQGIANNIGFGGRENLEAAMQKIRTVLGT